MPEDSPNQRFLLTRFPEFLYDGFMLIWRGCISGPALLSLKRVNRCSGERHFFEHLRSTLGSSPPRVFVVRAVCRALHCFTY